MTPTLPADFNELLIAIQAKGKEQGKADFLVWLLTTITKDHEERYPELRKAYRDSMITSAFNARKKAVNDILAELKLPVRSGKEKAE